MTSIRLRPFRDLGKLCGRLFSSFILFSKISGRVMITSLVPILFFCEHHIFCFFSILRLIKVVKLLDVWDRRKISVILKHLVGCFYFWEERGIHRHWKAVGASVRRKTKKNISLWDKYVGKHPIQNILTYVLYLNIQGPQINGDVVLQNLRLKC